MKAVLSDPHVDGLMSRFWEILCETEGIAQQSTLINILFVSKMFLHCHKHDQNQVETVYFNTVPFWKI